MAEQSKHFLIGKFFLTFDDGFFLRYQGSVLDVFDGGSGKMVAACLLYSAIDGYPTDTILYDVADMTTGVFASEYKILFYHDEETWRKSHEKFQGWIDQNNTAENI